MPKSGSFQEHKAGSVFQHQIIHCMNTLNTENHIKPIDVANEFLKIQYSFLIKSHSKIRIQVNLLSHKGQPWKACTPHCTGWVDADCPPSLGKRQGREFSSVSCSNHTRSPSGTRQEQTKGVRLRKQKEKFLYFQVMQLST